MKKLFLLACVSTLGCGLASGPATGRAPGAHPQNPWLPMATAAPAEAPGQAMVKNVGPEEAQKALAQKKQIVVLDVRTPEEFKSGHLGDATNLNFNASGFADQIKRLDKAKTYLVYCRSGRRSSRTRELMLKEGFQNIYHLEGGINAWKKAGQPLVK